jgi:hypothetical protein
VQHDGAKSWLDLQLNGSARVGIPWQSILAFLRIVTNQRMFRSPDPAASAWKQVTEWLSCPVVWIPQPTERHADLLGELISETRVTGNLMPDAHLAALAIEHGLTLCSTDSDFSRFSGLKWKNPLSTRTDAR